MGLVVSLFWDLDVLCGSFGESLGGPPKVAWRDVEAGGRTTWLGCVLERGGCTGAGAAAWWVCLGPRSACGGAEGVRKSRGVVVDN